MFAVIEAQPATAKRRGGPGGRRSGRCRCRGSSRSRGAGSNRVREEGIRQPARRGQQYGQRQEIPLSRAAATRVYGTALLSKRGYSQHRRGHPSEKKAIPSARNVGFESPIAHLGRLRAYRGYTSACRRTAKRHRPMVAYGDYSMAEGENCDSGRIERRSAWYPRGYPLNFFFAFCSRSAPDHPVYGSIVCRMARLLLVRAACTGSRSSSCTQPTRTSALCRGLCSRTKPWGWGNDF